MNRRRLALSLTALCLTVPAIGQGAPSSVPAANAALCSRCHQPESNIIRGFLKSVSLTDNIMVVDVDGGEEIIHFDNRTNIHNMTALADMKDYVGDGFRVFFVRRDNETRALHISHLDPMHIIGSDNVVDAGEVAAKLEAAVPPVVIDLRTPSEYLRGHIRGAINIPGGSAESLERHRPIAKDKALLVYGRGDGDRETEMVINLMSNGYHNVQYYQGGIPDWSRTHYTVCSLGYVNNAGKDDFFLRLVDKNYILDDAEGIPVSMTLEPDAIGAAEADLPADKEKPIIVYGRRYEQGAARLKRLGYADVKVIANGNGPWQEHSANGAGEDCSN